MFGIKNIKKRLEFVENELKYYRDLQERKDENKKKTMAIRLPVVNKNNIEK